VISAFHDIRKIGNEAAHNDIQKSTEDAVVVLQDLHFITGETAVKLGLIDDYPEFDDEIESYPDTDYVELEDIEIIARELFAAYVVRYNAQIEIENYYKHRVDKLRADYDNSILLCFSFFPAE
jgi:ClpP class serine protease